MAASALVSLLALTITRDGRARAQMLASWAAAVDCITGTTTKPARMHAYWAKYQSTEALRWVFVVIVINNGCHE